MNGKLHENKKLWKEMANMMTIKNMNKGLMRAKNEVREFFDVRSLTFQR